MMGMPPSHPCGVFHGRTEALSGSLVAATTDTEKHGAQSKQPEPVTGDGVSYQEAGCAGVT